MFNSFMPKVLITDRELTDENVAAGNYPGLTYTPIGNWAVPDAPFIYYADDRYKSIDVTAAFNAVCAEAKKRGAHAGVYDVPETDLMEDMLVSLDQQGVRLSDYGFRGSVENGEVKGLKRFGPLLLYKR
jgi:hypothetical protein